MDDMKQRLASVELRQFNKSDFPEDANTEGKRGDPRWVKYWAETMRLKRLGMHPSDARRIAWERSFGKE